MSLLDVLRGVMLDPAEQAAYNQDPSAYLERFGYDDVDPADLSEAFGLVADTLPAEQAQAGLSATAVPDGGAFGDVTSDFDGDSLATADVAGGADAAFEPTTPDDGGELDDEGLLPFGRGELEDDSLAGSEPTSADEPGDELADGLGETVDADDLADGLDDDGSAVDLDLNGDLVGDDADRGPGDDTDDGFDDLDGGDVGDGGDPADLDIGLF